MQELEKILEEIDNLKSECLNGEYEPAYGAGALDMANAIKDIIRKHLSRENDPEITRSSRDTEPAEEINLSEEEFEILRFADSATFRCGNEYVSLYMGEDEATREYKIVDDGWIPVEERSPEVFGKYWATIRYSDGRISEPVVVDFRGVKQKYVVDTPNGREYETWGIDSAFHGSRVIAWRPYHIPEPYHPGRSDNHDGE